MKRPLALFCLTLSVLPACATSPQDADSLLPTRPAAMAESESSVAAANPEEAAAHPAGEPGSAAAPASHRTPRDRSVELAIWNSPAFRKQFAESYLAETEIEPSVTMDEREAMLGILDLISAEKMDEAARLVEKNRDEDASAVFDFTLANIYFQQDRFDEAAALYQVAVKKFPKFRRAWRLLGQCYWRLGTHAQAIPALTRVIELGGNDAITYGLLGIAHTSVENHLSAESAFRMAALLDPETANWKMGLAESFFNQKRFADAVALFDSLIAEDSDRADIWLLQANAYLGLEKPRRAAENLEIVDRLGKSTADSLNLLGNIYVNEKLYDLASDAYIRALEKNPEASPGRAISAAKDLAARGAYDGTRRLIERIEALHGARLGKEEAVDMKRLEARIALAQGGRQEEYIARLMKIVELDPTDGEALIQLGQHASQKGDPERAIFYYERAANIEGFEADAKVRHAQLLVGQSKYGEALPLLRRAQELKFRENVQEYLEQVERAAKNR